MISKNIRHHECSICCDVVEENAFVNLECGHRFHKTCIIQWFLNNQSCPLCRQNHLQDFIKRNK
ncbi:hypothetical protein B4U80_00511 [Leptotrombidium deliense]|uniref:RING-type E3 ubiquitin transferase n=1 Tax=Leptotrombidium deliense TaxID=299467 RepID=A0A443RSH0_9ACAR|nr:hypothetical protein B4U80_00511 [Leptotrombidium deliense]